MLSDEMFEVTGEADSQTLQVVEFEFPAKLIGDLLPYCVLLSRCDARRGDKHGVLGVFLVPGAVNETFTSLAAAFPTQESGDAPVDDIDPAGLLPVTLDYWAYEGSLTTPPCSEIVDWMVAKQPLEVAAADIEKFTALYAMNARPALPANRRFILSSS